MLLVPVVDDNNYHVNNRKYIQCFLLARHCYKHFTYTNFFTSRINPEYLDYTDTHSEVQTGNLLKNTLLIHGRNGFGPRSLVPESLLLTTILF